MEGSRPNEQDTKDQSADILSKLDLSLSQLEQSLQENNKATIEQCSAERARLEQDLKNIQGTLNNLGKVYEEKLKESTRTAQEKEDLEIMLALYDISALLLERSRAYAPLINISSDRLAALESQDKQTKTSAEELQRKVTSLENSLNDPEVTEEFNYHEKIRLSKGESVEDFAHKMPVRYSEAYLRVISDRKKVEGLRKQIAEIEETKKFEAALEAFKSIRETPITLPLTYLSDNTSEITLILPIINKKSLSQEEEFLVNLYQTAILESISELINDENIKKYDLGSNDELVFKNYVISGLPLDEEGKEQRLLTSLSWKINDKLSNLDSLKKANLRCGSKPYAVNLYPGKSLEEKMEEKMEEHKKIELKKIESLVPEGYISEGRAVEILFNLDETYPLEKRKSNPLVQADYNRDFSDAHAEFKEAEEEGMFNDTIKKSKIEVNGCVYFKLEDIVFYKEHCLLPASTDKPKFVWFDEELLNRQQVLEIGCFEKGMNAVQLLINSGMIRTVQNMYPDKYEKLADQEQPFVPRSALMYHLNKSNKNKK